MKAKPLSPPKWVWELAEGTYRPTMEWNVLLKGYENWHEKGAKFPAGKGQSPDYKNYGVTLPSVAMSLRRYDEAHSGFVVVREPEAYWNAVIQASVAVVCRLRAEKHFAEAQASLEFDLEDSKKKVRRARRYIGMCHATRCPRFYVDKLPSIPDSGKLMEK